MALLMPSNRLKSLQRSHQSQAQVLLILRNGPSSVTDKLGRFAAFVSQTPVQSSALLSIGFETWPGPSAIHLVESDASH